MSEAVVAQPAAIESLLMSVPGAQTPLGRAALFGGAGMAVAYFVRPSLSFKPSGAPRSWIVTNGNDPEATLFPWWAWIVVPGALFSVFV